ncbi:hypothetical protein FRC09_009011 [Ceratobasidium sp. 395]|nr:hypothetical protein FRC09_009011 [Ceratobasidium sp. 395]
MSLLLPRSYSTRPISKIRESPDSLETELVLEEEPNTLLFKRVEVVEAQIELEDPPDSPPKSERQDTTVDEKVVEPEAAPQAPLDSNAKHEQNLKKAQDEWARRRKEGLEDYGAEMAKDAKIWQIYVRETDKADEELVDGWNKFVGISTQKLQQDPSDTSAQALLVISQFLLATLGDSTANTSSAGLEQASTEFRPSATAVAVNTLWFSSLSLSVAVSLIAMLAKEWCRSFMSGRSGETYERARLRQKRWNEIERLRMIDALTLLPLLIHLALLLFAVGLCIYLWDLNIAVAIPVIAITFVATLVYVSTAVHSLTAEHCPYTTASSKLTKSYLKVWLHSPISFMREWFYASLVHLRISAMMAMNPINSIILKVKAKLELWVRRYGTCFELHTRVLKLVAFISSCVRALRTSWATLFRQKVNKKHLMDAEDYLAHDEGMDITTSQMLSWLLVNCQDSRVTEALVYSLAGAEPWLPRLPLLEGNALSVIFRSLSKLFIRNLHGEPYRLKPGVSPDVASLYLRALQFLLGYYNKHGFILYTEPKPVIKNTWSHDFYVRNIGGMAEAIENEGFCLTIASASGASLHPRYLQLCQKGAIKMIEAHISCDIVLHPTTLIAMVRQMTSRLCMPTHLWKDHPDAPFQYCFLLLRLYLHSDNRDRYLNLQHAIAIGVAAAALNFGSFPGWSHPPGHITSTRAAEFVAYHSPPKSMTYTGKEISLFAARRYERNRLLEFGLLGLLELSQVYQLAPEDLDTWVTVLDRIHYAYFEDHVYIYSIPRTFTLGVHTARAVAKFLNNDRPSNGFTANHPNWLPCFSAICNWILKHKDDDVYDHKAVHSILLNSLCTVVSLEQQKYCAVLLENSSYGCTKTCLESLPSDMLTRLLAVSLSGNNFIALTAMRELWGLTKSMLALSENSPMLRSRLFSLMPFITTSAPKHFGELGLLQQWLPHLQKMCVEAPEELLDSGILAKIQSYYLLNHQEDVPVVRPFDGSDLPESIQGSHVTEMLQEIQVQCESAAASSNQPCPELPFNESTEAADG